MCLFWHTLILYKYPLVPLDLLTRVNQSFDSSESIDWAGSSHQLTRAIYPPHQKSRIRCFHSLYNRVASLKIKTKIWINWGFWSSRPIIDYLNKRSGTFFEHEYHKFSRISSSQANSRKRLTNRTRSAFLRPFGSKRHPTGCRAAACYQRDARIWVMWHIREIRCIFRCIHIARA